MKAGSSSPGAAMKAGGDFEPAGFLVSRRAGLDSDLDSDLVLADRHRGEARRAGRGWKRALKNVGGALVDRGGCPGGSWKP